MSQVVVQALNISKKYHLGSIGYGSLKTDFQTWFAKLMGKEDPNAKLDQKHINKNAEFWALKDVCFSLDQGDRLGIIGRNGAGKSTMLKILSRITTPTKGEFRVRGKVASMLEVGTGFVSELTGRDNIYLNGAILGMKRREIQKKFDEIVSFAGVEQFIDTPVKRYSSGMFVRLGFSVAAHLDTDVMIIDEVLSVGDSNFQMKSMQKMKEISLSGGKTIIFVSHSPDLVQGLCSKVLYMKKGQVHAFSDNVKETISQYNLDNE